MQVIKGNNAQKNLSIKTEKASRFEESIKQRILENKEYNSNIFDSEELLSRIEIQDNLFLVRCLKHEGEQDNDGLFTERKYQKAETENGRPTTKVDDYTYSTRVVVVKTPEAYKNLLREHIAKREDNQMALQLEKIEQIKVGDIVWITPNMNTSNYAFFTDIRYPVTQFEGYLLIPQGLIQMKESKTYNEQYA